VPTSATDGDYGWPSRTPPASCSAPPSRPTVSGPLFRGLAAGVPAGGFGRWGPGGVRGDGKEGVREHGQDTAADRDDLLATAEASLDMLTRLPAVLVDMTRLRAGGRGVLSRPADLEEIIGARLAPCLRRRRQSG
jgi:hypothetical protein